MLTLLNLSEAKMQVSGAGLQAPGTPSTRLLEAASPLIFHGGAFPAGRNDGGFRRISQASNAWRDLQPPMQWNMQRVSYYLYVTNPLARRIVELTKDFVIGEGVQIHASDPAVQRVLDDFWYDPANNMDMNLESFVREMAIFGEQIWYCATNPINGKVRLGYIDPYWIDAVEYATLDGLPGRAVTMPVTVQLKMDSGETEPRRLSVVAFDEDPSSQTYGQLKGECFYWAINKARAAHRGISDLFALADWLDGYDQMLFALMTQMDSLSRFIWDVTLSGMTGEQIQQWLKDNGTPPRPNSIRAHNEKVAWQAVAPPVQAADRSEGVRLIKNMNLGGAGFPEHWFADGASTNRATALVQGEPTLKMLTSRQRLVRNMLEQLLDFVVDRRIAAGVLPSRIDKSFQVVVPQLSVRDQEKAASALKSAADALTSFQSAGAVDTATMTQVLTAMLSHLGVQCDPFEILAKAGAEKSEPRQS
ncbi:MAG: hypothetical protein HYX72_00830 [Acidobacteria bacterium]|nr:hypothetical protein [Acidobacteriota bacterium]